MTVLYTTLAHDARHREVREGSEFIALATPAHTPDEAHAHLAHARDAHPDATHHCWAYRIGTLQRFHDDGEPGGTAGAPILRAIEGQGLDHVMVVVVRYYGGTKLGTGGLARAYGGAAAECLRLAARQIVRARVKLRVHVGFEHVSAVYRLLADDENLRRGEQSYDEHGLNLTLDLLEEDGEPLRAALRDVTRGAATVTDV